MEDISKKTRLNVRDIDALSEAGELLKTKASSGELDIFGSISFQDIAWLKKVNLSQGTLERLMELYKKTQNKKVKKIPLLKGQIGDYEYEMLSKKDIRGLIAGNLSQCCQRIGGIGNDCVYYGAEHEDSTFFIVAKKGQLVCQSWVWSLEDQACFDSIECVSPSYGRDVLECYKDYVKRALKESKDINVWTCGAYGRTGQTNVFSQYSEAKKLNGVYTDARTQYLIAKR
jgi:hypothetical protein